MCFYVGFLYFNIIEDMFWGIFEFFGKIDNIVLMKDLDIGCFKGYGFIMFFDFECVWWVLE